MCNVHRCWLTYWKEWASIDKLKLNSWLPNNSKKWNQKTQKNMISNRNEDCLEAVDLSNQSEYVNVLERNCTKEKITFLFVEFNIRIAPMIS
jgi:hypothetical protein